MSAQTRTIANIVMEDYVPVWVQSFLAAKKAENLSSHSIRYYRINLEVFTDYCESQSVKIVSQITPTFLRDFLLYLGEHGHNSGGIHGFYRSVRAFLNWYWEEVEPDERNPIDRVKPPKVPVEPQQGITRAEFDLLLSVCRNERDKAILMVLMDTGVRAEELCKIKIEEVNLVENSILIAHGKGRKPRTVFIGKRTRKQLRKYLRVRQADRGYLFINRDGEKLVYTALRQIIRRLCNQADIKGISPHDFRRGYAIECLRRGMDLLTLSRLLGHTSLALLPRYAKQTSLDLLNSQKSVIDD